MKDLLKSLISTGPKSPAKTSKAPANSTAELPAASSSGEVQAFLSQVAAMPKQGAVGSGRLLFALDATASRQPTWDVASQLQVEMFKAVQQLGGLQVQLSFFRGFAEFFVSDWHADGDSLQKVMASIQCEAGATKIERVLKHALKQSSTQRLSAVVFIGDAMEENLDGLADLAGQLGLRNVPVFMFQEHGDPAVKTAFKTIARLSGGAYSPFDTASADQLRALLKAVAVYASGGRDALKQLKSPAAVLLLEQLKS